jgi:hypothetical protein
VTYGITDDGEIGFFNTADAPASINFFSRAGFPALLIMTTELSLFDGKLFIF